MDIQEFVDETLTQIASGIRSAQAKEGGTNIVAAAPEGALKGSLEVTDLGTFTTVNFEITVLTETTLQGKGSLKVLSVEAGGGASKHQQHTHKIAFSVPVRLPYGDQSHKVEKQRKEQEQDERLRQVRRRKPISGII